MADHLRVEIETKECKIPEDVRLRMQEQLDRLEQKIHQLGSSPLWITVVHHPRSEVFHAQAKLKLPGETVITGYHHTYVDVAMQRCLDRVMRRVEAYQANPDQEALEHARRLNAAHTDLIAPVESDAGELGQAVTAGDYQRFRNALLSHEEWVRRRVGRWIQRYPDIQHQIGKSLEIADLVEEVFLLAFDQYAGRAKDVRIHEWLDGLIDAAVRDFWQNPDDRMAASYAQTLVGEGR